MTIYCAICGRPHRAKAKNFKARMSNDVNFKDENGKAKVNRMPAGYVCKKCVYKQIRRDRRKNAKQQLARI